VVARSEPDGRGLLPGCTVNFVGRLSADQIVEAFREDHCVKALGRSWPSTESERAQLLKDAGRPIDNILKLAWSLYTLDRDEALKTVHLTVWPPPLYLGDMIDAFKSNKRPTPTKVANLAANWMQGGFDPDEFLLIGYEVSPTHIQLEDGYNSSTTAGLVGVLPAKIKICLGQAPHPL
jgi:hypothetical protein